MKVQGGKIRDLEGENTDIDYVALLQEPRERESSSLLFNHQHTPYNRGLTKTAIDALPGVSSEEAGDEQPIRDGRSCEEPACVASSKIKNETRSTTSIIAWLGSPQDANPERIKLNNNHACLPSIPCTGTANALFGCSADVVHLQAASSTARYWTFTEPLLPRSHQTSRMSQAKSSEGLLRGRICRREGGA